MRHLSSVTRCSVGLCTVALLTACDAGDSGSPASSTAGGGAGTSASTGGGSQGGSSGGSTTTAGAGGLGGGGAGSSSGGGGGGGGVGGGGGSGGGSNLAACAEGVVSAACLCGATAVDSGYCCGGTPQATTCAAPSCLTGAVTSECTCGSTVVSSGYCCKGSPQVDACALPPAFYVSPTGNDANPGTSADKPFLTLEKARAAARASAAVKTVYLLGGVYQRTATLSLESQDAGQSWLAYPGQTPILEGGSSTQVALLINANNVTVRWITFRNFVKSTIGLFWGGANDVLIDSNTILNTLSDGWVQAAIYMCCGQHKNARITHNLIDGANYIGIDAGAATIDGGDMAGTTIAYNAVYRTCRTVADCGAIYLWDRDRQSSNVTVDNNVLGDFGTRAVGGRALYLDDNTSNVTLRNNVAYGTGDWAVQYHGGDHNLFTNNIFDISDVTHRLAVYQDTGDQTPPDLMSGNAFRCNIVYSSATPPSSLWDYYHVKDVVLPEVRDNVYWGKKGNFPNAAPIIDTNPKVADPGFVDPSARNYAFGGANPAESCGFKPIDVSAVGPLPNP
ncbi:MAG: right-handed parallel beta-helix repeat-containing protein [Sorangiineae bacterium]|nr:right-handed parallel beta-helix repeat-containing protein [Sorangiineae bacterium]